jgi:hypothetical protein
MLQHPIAAQPLLRQVISCVMVVQSITYPLVALDRCPGVAYPVN